MSDEVEVEVWDKEWTDGWQTVNAAWVTSTEIKSSFSEQFVCQGVILVGGGSYGAGPRGAVSFNLEGWF